MSVTETGRIIFKCQDESTNQLKLRIVDFEKKKDLQTYDIEMVNTVAKIVHFNDKIIVVERSPFIYGVEHKSR